MKSPHVSVHRMEVFWVVFEVVMKRKVLLLSAMTLAMGMFGCSTSNVPQIEAKYYPQCYDPIAKLCKDQDNSAEVKSAVVGGLIGAASGALIGGLTSKDKKGALIGAAAGAVAGAAAGFFKARLEKIQDREQRLAEYQTILGEVSAHWDLEKASVETALNCYDEQVNILQNLIKEKKISKEEFLDRMNEIKQGLENIETYWADASTKVDTQMADGEKFLEEEEARIQAEEQAKKLKAEQAKKDRETVKKKKVQHKAQMQSIKNGNEKISNAIKVKKKKVQEAMLSASSDMDEAATHTAMNDTDIKSFLLAAN